MSNPVRFYFDLPKSEDFDAHSIQIYELESLQDEGELIDTVKIQATRDWVETVQATDPFNFFKLTLVNADLTAKMESGVVLAEESGKKVLQLREVIKDTNLEDPGFSDNELINKMRLAAMRMNNSRNLTSIEDRFWPIIELLVRIDICHILAFDFARYQKLEIPGGPSYGQDELYDHYIRVADQLTKYYDQIKSDAVGPIDKMGDGVDASPISVTDMSRDSYVTGLEETSLSAAAWFNVISQDRIDAIRQMFVGSH